MCTEVWTLPKKGSILKPIKILNMYLGAFKSAEEAVRRCPKSKNARRLRLSVTGLAEQYSHKDDDIKAGVPIKHYKKPPKSYSKFYYKTFYTNILKTISTNNFSKKLYVLQLHHFFVFKNCL